MFSSCCCLGQLSEQLMPCRLPVLDFFMIPLLFCPGQCTALTHPHQCRECVRCSWRRRCRTRGKVGLLWVDAVVMRNGPTESESRVESLSRGVRSLWLASLDQRRSSSKNLLCKRSRRRIQGACLWVNGRQWWITASNLVMHLLSSTTGYGIENSVMFQFIAINNMGLANSSRSFPKWKSRFYVVKTVSFCGCFYAQ